MVTLDDIIVCPNKNCGHKAFIKHGFKVIFNPPYDVIDGSREGRIKLFNERIRQINGEREGLPIVQCVECKSKILLSPLAVIED